jgi:Immunity protein 35
VLNQAEARQIAEDFIRDQIQPRNTADLVIAELEEFPTCWVAIYNSSKFVDSGSFRDALAGNGPLIINKRTRAVRIGLTSQPVEQQLDRD